MLDSDGVIVVGDTRFKAAQQLGLKEVPVVIAGNLSPEQAKAYRLVDNQSVNLSDWDYNLLPIEVNELQAMNYDLNSLGFDAEELAKLLQTGLKDGLCDPDDVPAPPDEPTTRPGDVCALATIGSCPVIRLTRAMWIVWSMASRFIWSIPIRPTT